jgi:hypothetical protein
MTSFEDCLDSCLYVVTSMGIFVYLQRQGLYFFGSSGYLVLDSL